MFHYWVNGLIVSAEYGGAPFGNYVPNFLGSLSSAPELT